MLRNHFLFSTLFLAKSLLAAPFATEILAAKLSPTNTLLISGHSFGNAPKATLEGVPLVLISATDIKIEAKLPAGLAPGTYDLDVARNSQFHINSNFDEMGLTLGAQGPQGPQGLPGIIGPEGPQGPMGPAGVNGAKGVTGATGPQGPIGLTGAAGPQGPTGPKGDMGVTGAAGVAGPQGPVGLPGVAGTQGPQGSAGPKGDMGATGASGSAGEVGPAGPQGPVGPKGDVGATGAVGPVGLPGPMGLQGPVGPKGDVGVSGMNGADGKLSVNGTSPGQVATWNGANWIAAAPAKVNVTLNNMQPYLVLNYQIALFGIFPSRNSENPFIGEIMIFAGNFAVNGWATCDGQLLAINQNQALFSLLGTQYGGNGQTTFALPDLRGRVGMHMGNGPGLTPRVIGEMGGAENASGSF